MISFLSINQLKSWVSTKERLIPKQNIILATLTNTVRCGNLDLLPGSQIKIIGRVTDKRFAISGNITSDTTDAIVTEDYLKDIRVES